MIIVDTCTIIWNALKPSELSHKAMKQIELSNTDGGIIFCEISLWEIAMLIKKNRLDPGTHYHEFIELVLASNKYIITGLTPEIAEISVNLSKSISQDPADRMIVATSIAHSAPLVTADENLRRSKIVKTIW